MILSCGRTEWAIVVPFFDGVLRGRVMVIVLLPAMRFFLFLSFWTIVVWTIIVFQFIRGRGRADERVTFGGEFFFLIWGVLSCEC
eukprot:m.220252 g.220252  ORF g.220252 m.220252 type:complete len:85 (-) comp33312_c1_seq18:40-294(-)